MLRKKSAKESKSATSSKRTVKYFTPAINLDFLKAIYGASEAYRGGFTGETGLPVLRYLQVNTTYPKAVSGTSIVYVVQPALKKDGSKDFTRCQIRGAWWDFGPDELEDHDYGFWRIGVDSRIKNFDDYAIGNPHHHLLQALGYECLRVAQGTEDFDGFALTPFGKKWLKSPGATAESRGKVKEYHDKRFLTPAIREASLEWHSRMQFMERVGPPKSWLRAVKAGL